MSYGGRGPSGRGNKSFQEGYVIRPFERSLGELKELHELWRGKEHVWEAATIPQQQKSETLKLKNPNTPC